jgi:hypothetical protein
VDYVYIGNDITIQKLHRFESLGEKKMIELGVLESRHKVEALQGHCGNDVNNLERVLLKWMLPEGERHNCRTWDGGLWLNERSTSISLMLVLTNSTFVLNI